MLAYSITNSLSGKQYIGITIQTLNTRWSEHLSRSKYTSKSAIHSAIRKYGKEIFIIEHIASAKSIEDLKELEILLIKQHNTFRNGYNLTPGGEFQEIHEETKKKISQSKLGHPVSAETREKLKNHFNKKWKVYLPDGKVIIIDNLKKFCSTAGLNYYSLRNTNESGYTCFKHKVEKI